MIKDKNQAIYMLENMSEPVGNSMNILNNIDEKLLDDKEIIKVAVRKDPYALKYFSMRYGNDVDVVIEAVKSDSFALQFASEELKNNKDIVLEAMKQNGTNLRFASKDLQKDKDVVLEAMNNSKSTAFLVSGLDPKLKSDRDIMLAATKKDAAAIFNGDLRFLNDPEFINAALNNIENLRSNGKVPRISPSQIKELIQINNELLQNKDGINQKINKVATFEEMQEQNTVSKDEVGYVSPIIETNNLKQPNFFKRMFNKIKDKFFTKKQLQITEGQVKENTAENVNLTANTSLNNDEIGKRMEVIKDNDVIARKVVLKDNSFRESLKYEKDENQLDKNINNMENKLKSRDEDEGR